MGRRKLFAIGASLLGAAAVVAAPTHLRATPLPTGPRVIDITTAPYNASGVAADNTSAFQGALSVLAAVGGGVILVPPGYYTMLNPVSLSSVNASISIIGSGQALSILVIKHAMTAFSFAYSYVGDNEQVVIRDIGFAAAPGTGAAGTAVAITMPQVTPSAWASCLVENVDFGVQYPGYTNFSTGLSLTNIWRSKVANCNMHSTGASGTFVALNGFCIDNKFESNAIDGVQFGYVVNGYSEGIHITSGVVIGSIGFTSGTSSYSGNGVNTPAINILGLYIQGCEFNCSVMALNLYQVSTCWISDTHFNAPITPIVMTGSNLVHIHNCEVTAAATPASIGVGVYPSNAGLGQAWPANGIDLVGVSFMNVVTAVVLGAGTTNTTGRELKQFGWGLGSLIGAPVYANGAIWQTLVDRSGNTKNVLEFVASTTAINHATDRFLYSQTQ